VIISKVVKTICETFIQLHCPSLVQFHTQVHQPNL
jgi:hypothetical protein